MSDKDMGDPIAALTEECSEVIKEHMKMVRFPPGHPMHEAWVSAGNPPPRDLWVQEIGDVLAVVEVLVRRGLVTREELRYARNAKLRKLQESYVDGGV